MPVIVKVYVPRGVLMLVVTVSVDVNVGLPEDGLKLAEAPDGRPEQLKETEWVGGYTNVTVTL